MYTCIFASLYISSFEGLSGPAMILDLLGTLSAINSSCDFATSTGENGFPDAGKTAAPPVQLLSPEAPKADPFVPSYLLPTERMPICMHVRQERRFMTQWAWTDAFEKAFLGVVDEGEVLAAGFGETVRQGLWENRLVVAKQFHRDDDIQELLKEVFLGLLIASTRCLGLGMNAAGEARLASDYLPHTAHDRLVPDLDFNFFGRLKMARGALMAVSCISQMGIVHCDLKPDSFMIGHDDIVSVIDFGSASRPGEAVPMSCQSYRPGDIVVSTAWDIYSLGTVLCEVFS